MSSITYKQTEITTHGGSLVHLLPQPTLITAAKQITEGQRPPHIKDRALPAGRSHDCVKRTIGRTGLRPWGPHLTAHVATTQCELSKVLAGSFPAKVTCEMGWFCPP